MTAPAVQTIIEPMADEPESLHRIEDDLSESWVEDWARAGVKAIEEYLAKHLAFLAYLDESAPA